MLQISGKVPEGILKNTAQRKIQQVWEISQEKQPHGGILAAILLSMSKCGVAHQIFRCAVFFGMPSGTIRNSRGLVAQQNETPRLTESSRAGYIA